MIEKAVLSVEEAGRYLGIGRDGAYAGVRRGEIPSIRIGRRYLVPRAALEQMLALRDNGHNQPGEEVIPHGKQD